MTWTHRQFRCGEMKILTSAVLCLALATLTRAAALESYALETEARREPVGIDSPAPRLSWKLRSSERAQRQTAYQILVATDPAKLVSGQADSWDSGRVASDETTWIPYAGQPLRSFTRYVWAVRVWDAGEKPSEWSEPASWTTAVVDRKDWREMWLSFPGSTLTSGPMPLLRKEFNVEKPVRRALVMASAPGFYELRLNGTRVGDHALGPAWTNYRSTVFYETYDVTSMVTPGPNAIGALIGNGFFNVAGGRYAKYTGSFGRPRIFVRLHIEYEDGTAADVFSDRSWKTASGPITFTCIYGGEDFDARLEPAGWDRAGFDDRAWRNAPAAEPPAGVLRAQFSPPVRVQQTFKPVRVTEPKTGVFVYDLGQNFSGWPMIEVSGAAGSQVRLIPGELLDPKGFVSQRTSGGPMSYNYTLAGQGRESWAPRFSYYGFRYVQVEGAAPETNRTAGVPTLHKLEGQFVHLDAPRAGTFASSNDLLNRVHHLILSAIRSNMQHVFTDCPHREKLGWLEQTHLMAPALLYNYDLRTFLPKIIGDIREAQTGAGMIPGIAPEYHAFRPEWRDLPVWGSAGVLLPSFALQWYGDRQPLTDSYQVMKRYAEYLDSKSTNGILRFGLNDWYDIGSRNARGKLTPLGLTATAVQYENWRVLERAAGLLGRTADVKQFSAMAERTRDAFQKEFYDSAAVTYGTGSQTSLGMPLTIGLAPPAARENLLEKLIADIRQKNNHTTSGEVGFPYVVRALVKAGRSDVLYDMATRTDPPSYGAQLGTGATTLTESWVAGRGGSQNHFMLGHLDEWFFSGLGGIRPELATPGMRRIRIEPEVVGDLESVECAWDSVRGTVAVKWRAAANLLNVSIDIPPGITGEICLPAASADQVREGSTPASAARGLRFSRLERGKAVFEAASGQYRFEIGKTESRSVGASGGGSR